MTAHRFASIAITQRTNGARIHVKGRTTIPQGDLAENRDASASTSYKHVHLRLIQRGPNASGNGVKKYYYQVYSCFPFTGKRSKTSSFRSVEESRGAFFSLVP